MRVDHPEPAPDDVRGGERRPVGEGKAGPQMEDDAATTVADIPRRSQRRPQHEFRVEGGDAFVDLGCHRGRSNVALGGRIQGGRGAADDRHAVLRRTDRGGAPGPDERHDEEDEDEEAATGAAAPAVWPSGGRLCGIRHGRQYRRAVRFGCLATCRAGKEASPNHTAGGTMSCCEASVPVTRLGAIR